MDTRMMRLMPAVMLACFSMGHGFSIDGTAPSVEFKGSTDNNPIFAPIKAAVQDSMNSEVKRAFDTTLSKTRAKLAGFKEQKELAQGFANANAYSMNSATLQGFQNYSIFAVATGLMVGVQAPSTSFSYYSKIAGDITKKGDLYAGLGAGFNDPLLNAPRLQVLVELRQHVGTRYVDVGRIR